MVLLIFESMKSNELLVISTTFTISGLYVRRIIASPTSSTLYIIIGVITLPPGGAVASAISTIAGSITVHSHVCISIPFGLDAIVDTFHVPIAPVVENEASVTLVFV